MSTDPEEHGPEAPEPAAAVAASANGRGGGGGRGNLGGAARRARARADLAAAHRDRAEPVRARRVAARAGDRGRRPRGRGGSGADGLRGADRGDGEGARVRPLGLGRLARCRRRLGHPRRRAAAGGQALEAARPLRPGRRRRTDSSGCGQSSWPASSRCGRRPARFAQAAARETVDSAAKRTTEAVEQEGELLLRELAGVLRSPGRAGIGMLGRLAGR